MNFYIIGTGLWSSVMAERITSIYKIPVTMFERRSYCGGNCYSSVNLASGIEVHHYGTHIFHTSNKNVWEYITKFADFTPYRHTVLTHHNGKVFSMPINLHTINQFYDKSFSPADAEVFVRSEILRDKCEFPSNLEEKALAVIGRPLYEAFIKGYTHKQWEHDPRDLPPEIIARLPVRYNYNTDYFSDYWQGLPLHGYYSLFKNLLSNPLIKIEYNTDFYKVKEQLPSNAIILYTGLPDALYDYQFGELEWRSLIFEFETLVIQDLQGTSVINYADLDKPYTRIHEFKHLHPERITAFENKKTVICREYSKKWTTGEDAYYPINNKKNNDIYSLYKAEAKKSKKIILGGRLGKYRYFDMDKCIEDALNTFSEMFEKIN